jgi:hypothetical protein
MESPALSSMPVPVPIFEIVRFLCVYYLIFVIHVHNLYGLLLSHDGGQILKL